MPAPATSCWRLFEKLCSSCAATHLIAWAILLGSNFYTTFIMGIIMYK